MRGRWLTLLVALVAGLVACGTARAASGGPASDPFYSYSGSAPLSSVPLGTVLKTRTVPYHIVGIPTALKVVQLLYRTVNGVGDPAVNVTSVVQPPAGTPVTNHVVAYQSFYDSLNPADEPSWQIQGGVTLGGAIPDVETLFIAPFLAAGDPVVIADTEGEAADFASGIEYGENTLYSLRAALASPAAGLPASSRIALLGYSGGAIATQWASELAPADAPDIDTRLVGSAYGGVFVDPLHNLSYINGSSVWAGLTPMALIGVARSFDIDISPYLSAYGAQLTAKMQNDSIVNVLAQYPGLTFASLVKPQYANPTSIPPLVQTSNQLIMGSDGTPDVPQYIGQGTGGVFEGTPAGGAGIGVGDGVMVTGDVRALANEYCGRGVSVLYRQYPTGHISTALAWTPTAVAWIDARFAGAPAVGNCGLIAPGNSLAPAAVTAPGAP